MRTSFYFVLAVLVAVFMVNSCTEKGSKTEELSKGKNPAKAQQMAGANTGTVLETIDSGGYTYVNVKTEDETLWAAAPQTQVKVGDKVMFPEGMPMKDFRSKTLNRTFDLVYFVPGIQVQGAEDEERHSHEGSPAADHPKTAPSIRKATEFSGIEKPKGGKTVAELYAEKTKLSGKEVVLRGKVVKFSSGIMGKNWIHLRDGSGEEGSNDLTVTAENMANVGDTVLVKGIVVVNKDFGSGYQYDVIIENAQVTVE